MRRSSALLVVALLALARAAHGQAPADALRAALEAERLMPTALVHAVLAVNPGLEAARQSVSVARARVRQAGAFPDPMLEAEAAPLSVTAERFGFMVGVSQSFPWFGKRGRERDVMRAEAAAATCDLELMRRELAASALGLYYRYFVAQRSLEVNAEHAALLGQLAVSARAQMEAGQTSSQAALQVDIELLNIEREALALNAERDVIIAQLNALLHRHPAAKLPPVPSELAPREAPAVDAKQALEGRSEIAAMHQRAQVQVLKEDALEREYYPEIRLSTSYSTMWDMPEHRWSIGVGVNLPWPNEKRAGALDEARATRAQLESEAERMLTEARSELYVAQRKLEQAKQVLSLLRAKLLPLARERVVAAQAELTVRPGALLGVIEAERGLREIELQEKLAQADEAGQRVELERALGKIPGY